MDLSNRNNNHRSFSLENFISISIMRSLLTAQNRNATILVYHNIPSVLNRTHLQANSVTKEHFEQQMRFLKENSFNVIPLQQLISQLEKGEKIENNTVAITFDDGYKTNITNAFPILQKYNIPASIFLAAGYIGKNKIFPWVEMPDNSGVKEELTSMDWQDVKKLHDAGIEIGSHTYSHQFLPKMNDIGIEDEILKSQTTIEEKIGTRPFSFAFPFSFPVIHWNWPNFKSTVVKILKKNSYMCCCTTLRGHVSKKSNPYFLKRIVIGKFDSLDSFHAKLIGAYVWTRIPQMLFQTFVKQYNI